MDWSGGNDAHGMRFENRTLPNYPSYGINAGWVNSPLYGTTSGVNQYTLPMVTTGVRQTPAAMTHGEVATCRIAANAVGGPAYGDPTTVMASITAAATPRVVTTLPHHFTTGQKIFHVIPAGNGMAKLDRFPATITVINSTTYDITNLSTAGQTAYTANSGTCYVYMSLNVGARGEFPIVFSAGDTGPGAYGDGGNGTYLSANDLKTFYFDKTIIGKSDGAGNYIKGAWIFAGPGNSLGHWDGVPLEVLTKLIVELNQMGPKNPISMWIDYPHRGLCSIDPDYSAASNWAVKATDVILNGNTIGGVNYPGLKTVTGANLYIEYCNEIWNPIPSSPQSFWHSWYSYSRWGAISRPDAHALRATAMARDIKTAFPSETKIKYVLGMWGVMGMRLGDGYGNYGMWHGSVVPGAIGYLYSTDSVASAWGPAKNWHDAVAIAPYFEAGQTYYTGSGAGSLTDDSAMYAGTSPYSSPNQTQALTNYINAALTATDGGPALNYWPAIQDEFVANMGANQYVIHYEGGANWSTSGSLYSHTITAADTNFLIAAYRCSQLGTALVNYFNTISAKPNSAMPAVFLSVNTGYRWSFGAPDSYGTTSTEGGTLTTNPAWMALNARNASVR